MFNIGVVGATGLIGRRVIDSLLEEQIPINSLRLYASSKSKGTIINEIAVEELTEDSFKGLDVCFFCAGKNISKEFIPLALYEKVLVIDNSSYYRFHEDVALIVPEVNMNVLSKRNRLIANPNCSTIQSVIPLSIIDKLFDAKEVIYSTYQAVSGSGKQGLDALDNNTDFYGKPISDNCIPKIDNLLDNGYTFEEYKMIHETRKILNKDIKVSSTSVRVPVHTCHGVSITVKCKNEINLEKLKLAFNNEDSLVLTNEIIVNTEVANQNKTYVLRLRKDYYDKKTIHLYTLADNTRRGAAYNAVLILKELIERNAV